MTTKLNYSQMKIIAGNSTNYEMVVAGVMKRQETIHKANYIWSEVMGKNPMECGRIKLVRGDK